MSVSDEILNRLIYKSEGVDLDFKQAQYRFVGAEEREKSEVLKDILAIANAWRDGTGYILIGFKDSTPHPAEVVGIDSAGHIDDAQLQQFINGKVKPSLNFKYEERMYAGKHVGIISIPKQPRPFYLSAPYGRLKSNVVYVRRGSATDEASPVELIEMSKADTGPGDTQISIEMLDHKNNPQSLSQTLRFLEFDELPDFAYDAPRNGFTVPMLHNCNENYYRDLAKYAAQYLGSIRLKFRIRNQSNFPLKDFKLEIRVTTPDVKYEFIQKSRFPDKPTQKRDYSRVLMVPKAADPHAFRVERKGEQPVCFARADSLLPGEESLSDPFLIRMFAACEITIEVRVLAEELPTPIAKTYGFSVTGGPECHDDRTLVRMLQNVGE